MILDISKEVNIEKLIIDNKQELEDLHPIVIAYRLTGMLRDQYEEFAKENVLFVDFYKEDSEEIDLVIEFRFTKSNKLKKIEIVSFKDMNPNRTSFNSDNPAKEMINYIKKRFLQINVTR